MEFTSSAAETPPLALTSGLAPLWSDPQRSVLVLPDPAFPSARLLQTCRSVFAREGLALETVTETELTAILQGHSTLLRDRLVRLPADQYSAGSPAQLFVDRDGLITALHQAGCWVHLLPRLASWGVITDQLAWLAVLERGRILPPEGYEAVAPALMSRRPHRPEDNPNFVDPWLGKRSNWCGVPTAVRREA